MGTIDLFIMGRYTKLDLLFCSLYLNITYIFYKLCTILNSNNKYCFKYIEKFKYFILDH